MRKVITSVLTIVICIACSFEVHAHHSSALYTTDKQITLKGTVTRWTWTNPHCFLAFDVKAEDGTVQHWGAETQNPTDMTARGFSRTSFKPGDVITITLMPARNGAPVGLLRTAVLPDGQVLDGTNRPSDASKPAP